MSDESKNLTPSDFFQLYDLRVEAICPEGNRIMCGAKAGDHFIMQGEMVYLPPGQGISIYSLGQCLFSLQHKQPPLIGEDSCHATFTASQAASNRPE